MKPSIHFSQILHWSVISVVIAAVMTTVFLTNITLRSIEKNLPITLLTELESLDLLFDDLAEVVSAAEATRRVPNPENHIQLRHKVNIVFDGVVKLRDTYVFDNLIRASAFHAVIAPAISDVQFWLAEGVSGYGPETATTLDIVHSRITNALSKARTLKYDSQTIAQKILDEQRFRLERFLFRVNLLFLMTLTITAIMIFLIFRRQVLLRRELEALTELRRAEKTLQETEELYSKLVAAIPDIVVRTDVNGKILFLNDVALRISGYQRSEIQGKSLLEFIAPEDQESAIENMSIIFDRSLGPKEYAIVMKDGKKIPFEINSDVLRRNDGSQYGIVNICRDITERKRAEEEKRNLEERLNRAEKMESLGIMAGGVAHDLNNVLGIVVGYAEMLLMGADKSSPVRSKLVNIMEAGQKAATIVGDLLTLARRGVSGRDVVNLNKIIADLQQSPEFEKLFSYNLAVKIKTDLDPDLLNISGSSVHLNKTLFNLVSNASEAMKKGGCVTIKTANRYLDKPIHGYDKIQEGDYVILSVSDTGEGINADDIKRIFEPFYTKKVMGRSGTGLGLAVVWSTVKDHNGYINVESEEGRGSTFTLYFPVTREELSAESLAVSVSEYMGKGESILVIDDVKEQQNLAEEMLRKLNYSVTSVSSGEAALTYLQDHKVDLLVLDMIMDPGMDGLDTYRQALKIHPKQKAIIVSGFSESDRVKAAQTLGAGAYVKKPYVIEKLGLAVRKELDRSV